MSRQNYYARHRQRQRRQVDGELVAGLVARERRLQPRLGTRKLYHLLKDELQEAGVRIGRDRMFEELRERNLLLEPIAAQYPRTTNSYHNLPVFENLIKSKQVQGPNEVWVSDLSYLRTREGFLYLALITDKYGSVAEFVGNPCGKLWPAGRREDEFFALTMACGGIPEVQTPDPRVAPNRVGCITAIHGRSGARVALLQSPIPRTARAR